MELCECNLKEYIQDNNISLKDKKLIALQILLGLKYIHNENYIHRDIKLSNIFYGKDKKVKIGDFGLVTNINDIDNEDVGTIGYTAPEIISGKEYDERADLYSLGVVFLEIFCNIKTDMGKMYLIKDARNNKLTYEDQNIEYILNGLLNVNPDKRHSLDECISLLNKIIN